MSIPLLVEYYEELPRRRAKEDARAWRARRDAGVAAFRKLAEKRYNEGTLLRLLEYPSGRARQAALMALGLFGTMASNAAVAARLRDPDPDVRGMASETIWSLWFRADTEANNRELQRLMRLADPDDALAGYDRLIQRAPGFAEAYNQRAMLAFRRRDYRRSAADCARVLRLNPHHFGAQAGMAQCYLQLRKPRAALKAFRQALRINPYLDGVAETIRTLEKALGEDRK